jgi:hypothetical protein
MSTNAFRQISSVLVMVVICAAAPGLAAAQTPAQKTAQAEEFFNEGLKQMSVGRFAEACTAFERSQSIEASIGTLMNLANCREKNGQLATAMQLFSDSAEQLRGATDPDSAALRKVSTDRAAALKPRVSRLTLRIAADQPDGFELRVGDTVIPNAEWNQSQPLDGGTHQVSAAAPGHQPWSESVTVANEGDNRELGVPLLVPQVDTGAQLEVPRRPLPAPPPPSGPSQILPISLGVGALVFGAGAIVLDLNARGIQDDAVAKMDEANTYPRGSIERNDRAAASQDLHDKAVLRRYIAQGIGVAAIGCAGAAVYLYLRNRGEESTATAQRSITPMWGVDGEGGGVAGMQLSGSW